MICMNAKQDLPYCYKYERMMVAIDVVIFTILDDLLKVLLVKRPILTKDNLSSSKNDHYGLLGGIVRYREGFDEAVNRVLEKKAHIHVKTQEIYVEQLYTFDAVDRDPRDRIVSVTYYTLVKSDKITLFKDDNLEWIPAYDLPKKLVIDHDQILQTAITRLVAKIEYNTIPFSFLDEKFTFPQLQSVYEALLNKKLDNRNFRKKFIQRKLIIPTKEFIKFENQARKPIEIFKRNTEIGTNLKRSLFY